MSVCGCSPVDRPEFRLIIKDDQNKDRLNPAFAGSFNKDNIKISYKDNGVSKNISFIIRQPFSYGENLKNTFPFNQIISTELVALRLNNKANEFFLNLGDGQVHTLTFDYDISKGNPENVKIDDNLIQPEPSLPDMYRKIYYLLK